MPKPLNSWSKRLLFEIRMLIRRHADEHQDEMTIGQVMLLGTALREMGASMADTAALRGAPPTCLRDARRRRRARLVHRAVAG